MIELKISSFASFTSNYSIIIKTCYKKSYMKNNYF